jgi:hypothetical protein
VFGEETDDALYCERGNDHDTKAAGE